MDGCRPEKGMHDGTWDADAFAAGLSVDLDTVLMGAHDARTLARAVDVCAAAAEKVCGGRPMACAAGCPHCCVLNAAILLPEGMIAADWLRQRLSPVELDEVREELAAHRTRARWMDDEERIVKLVACPLLDAAGSCTIHPVRPLVCRAASSLDREACRRAFRPVITDEPRTVPADLLRRAAYDEAFRALAGAMGDAGLDSRSIELGAGILAFLDYPDYRDLLCGGGRLPDDLWL
jgi:Fe-S-cluster containining protein